MGLTGSVCVVVVYRKGGFLRKEYTKEVIVAWNREKAGYYLHKWLEFALDKYIAAPLSPGLWLLTNGELEGYRWEFFDEQIKDY